MELMIPLNAQDVRPLYEQIYQYIKDEIRNGNLRPQKQLPSSRELAKSLKVSRSTTQLAYEQLVSEGYLEAVPRKGYYPASLDGILPPVDGDAAGAGGDGQSAGFQRAGGISQGAGFQKSGGTSLDECPRGANAARRTGDPCAPGISASQPAYQVDFSLRGIDLESFPFSTWRKISRAVLREEEKELFLKGDPQGDLPLREEIRAYLHAARGVNCEVSQIIMGAGNEYLLMLLSGLLGRDAGIAMEDPTYKQAYRVLSGMGHAVYPVGMDAGGFRISELLRLPERVKVAYVMPSHQFPLGIVMPVKRRQELLSWAGDQPGRYLIEDDYDSEFRYKGKPIPALQGLDQAGRVIYMGTFSRAIAPAIRVGYLVLPPSLLARYEEQARFYSCTVSRVDQRILTQFIAGGYFERHLNRMREIYKGKHDALLAALRPLEQTFRIEGEYAGLHVLLTHRDGRTEEELLKRAEEAGVQLYGLSQYFIHREAGSHSRTVVLGYARLDEEEIRRGAELLVKAFSE